jgi:hypothetical protein
MAVPVILRRPLLGYGPGEGGGAINYRTPDGNLTIDLGLVALAADLGLLGLGAYMGILILSIVALIRIGFRQRSSPFSAEFGLATALCVLITTRLVLAQGDNDAFFDIMFGLAIGAIYLAKREQPTTGVSVGAGAAIRGDRSKPVA